MKPNDPNIHKVTKSLINTKPPNQPLLGDHGLIYDSQAKSEQFATTLELQFTCLPIVSNYEEDVANSIQTLIIPDNSQIRPISPGEVKHILKHLPREKYQVPMAFQTLP